METEPQVLGTIRKKKNIHIYYSFDTGEYHESVGLVFTRVPQARA